MCVCVYGLSKVAREERWLKGMVERRKERKESGERSWSRDKCCVYMCVTAKESQRKRGLRGCLARQFFFTYLFYEIINIYRYN